jgi:alpha-tubulin suppressor-like RCC1 family protein
MLLTAVIIAMLVSFSTLLAHPADAAGSSSVLAWGQNGGRQLGYITTASFSSFPKGAGQLPYIKAVEGGDSHSLALKTDGTVWAWGSNSSGQLGPSVARGSSTYTPAQVAGAYGSQAIAAGSIHSLALRTDGTVRAWGHNGMGQLGTNSVSYESSIPQAVHNLSGVRAIAAGCYHSLALKTDGTVWAWGSNSWGQLGAFTDNSFGQMESLIPVKVMNLSGVQAIAAGCDHSLALGADGTVWAWGSNHHGQLGSGLATGLSTHTPIRVAGLSKVTSVAGGDNHSLALRTDGRVWAWGDNRSGQLGNGNTTTTGTPVQVASLTKVQKIAGGGSHSLALKEDGTAWAWGDNRSGQLGNGATAPAYTPVQVRSPAGAKSISGGSYHSLEAYGG